MTKWWVIGLISLVGCSSGNDGRFDMLQKPVAIVSAESDIVYHGRTTKAVYVANQHAGTISGIVQDYEKLFDTDLGDDFEDSPLIVGGEPVALAVDEREAGSRIYVADAFNRRILAFDVDEGSGEIDPVLTFSPVDLGTEAVAVSSRPQFRNSGRFSTPTMRDVMPTTEVQNEHWDLIYEEGTPGYRVQGSKTGILTARAEEGVAYTTEDGNLTFTVLRGGERSTEKDRFRFGTLVTKPLNLTGRPIDLLMEGREMFVVMNDPPSVSVFDLDALTISSTHAMPDTDAILGAGCIVDEKIYVPNETGLSVYGLPLSNPSAAETLAIGNEVRSVRADESGTRLYLMSIANKEMLRWNLNEGELESSVVLNDYGYDFKPYTYDDADYALIPLGAGAIDVFDVTNQERWDARVVDEERQSTTAGQEFFDVEPGSKPELVSINTLDGVTVTEQWQLTFEGVVEGLAEIGGTLSGVNLVGEDGVDFESLGVEVGDWVSFAEETEEAKVESVESATTLVLDAAPSVQGDVIFSIRAAGQYVVSGAISGPQMGRVEEGVSYLSDNEAIALTIRPDQSYPTSRGDFFSFYSIDGFDPIHASNKRMARSAVVFIRPGTTVPTAYVVHQGSNMVTGLNLKPSDLYERLTIQ